MPEASPCHVPGSPWATRATWCWDILPDLPTGPHEPSKQQAEPAPGRRTSELLGLCHTHTHSVTQSRTGTQAGSAAPGEGAPWRKLPRAHFLLGQSTLIYSRKVTRTETHQLQAA